MYILLCSDDSYYTGSTIDLEKRLIEHQSGNGSNHTKKRLPVKLVYCEEFQRIDEAFYREKQVQGWSRAKKEALINSRVNNLNELATCKNESHFKNKNVSIKMKTTIQNKLRELEQLHNIKILYACETGSRAWGFPSPDSDYDVRIIYKHEVDWYLSLSDKKDTIEFMSEDRELDITGWDIKKCLKLMWKSNASVFERLQSPIVYKEENNVSTLLTEYANKCFAPIATMHHYLGMAKNCFLEIEDYEEIKLKKLFYSLRASLACKWIRDKNSIPPLEFITMVHELKFDENLKERIKALITIKLTKDESYIHQAEYDLNTFIKHELELAEKVFPTLAGREEKDVDLDTLFKQVVKTF